CTRSTARRPRSGASPCTARCGGSRTRSRSRKCAPACASSSRDFRVPSLEGVPRFILLVTAIVLLVAAGAAVFARDDAPPAGVAVIPTPPGVSGEDVEPLADPYAWDPKRADDFAERAAAGNSHLLYALSPGGAVASAQRTARWRPLVERAADEAGVDADTLEGLVFLESAGR